MNPDPNAYRPSSLDLEDAARMKSESELESTQAHTMRNNRCDIEYEWLAEYLVGESS